MPDTLKDILDALPANTEVALITMRDPDTTELVTVARVGARTLTLRGDAAIRTGAALPLRRLS